MGLVPDWKLSRDVVKLAAPVVLGMVVQTAMNLADTIMVGFMSDEAESVAGVAAIGVTLPMFWAVGGFLSAIAVGTQALTARRFGEERYDLSGRVLYNSLSIAVTMGITLSILGVLLAPKVFPFFNSNPEVMKAGIPYAQARFAAVFSMVATFSYKSFFDGIGKTYVAMVASMVMNVLNLALNAVLIYGLFGFPQLGVLGAGIGTLIASYAGLIIIATWSFGPKYLKKFNYYRKKNFNPFVIKEIVRLSLPGGLATVFVMTGFLLFLKIVGLIDRAEWLATFPRDAMIELDATLNTFLRSGNAGDITTLMAGILPHVDHMTESTRLPLFTAGTKVIIDLMSLSFVSAIALGTGTATLVSQNLGAGNARMAERYGWEAVKIAAYSLGIFGLLQAIFPHFFLGLFTDKQPVILAAASSMRVVALVNWMVGAGLVFMHSLFGAGNAKFVMYVEMTLHLLCLVPLAYLFGVVFGWQMEGLWLAAAIYVVSLGTILGWKFWQGKWKYIKI